MRSVPGDSRSNQRRSGDRAPATCPAHLAARFSGFELASHAGGDVVFASLVLPEDAVALAFPLETTEGFLDGLALAELDKNHISDSPPVLPE
jgi:hypothetical protein